MESQYPDPLPDNTTSQKMVVDAFEDKPKSSPHDSCVIEALTGININEATTTWDFSIGNTTLLDTFEGLSHNDIVTPMLLELKEAAEENPLSNLQEIVTVQAKSSITETFHLLEDTPFHPISCSLENKKSGKVSPTQEIIFPSVVKAPELVDPLKLSICPPALLSSNPSVTNPSFSFHLSHQSKPLREPLCPAHPKVDPRFDGNEALLAKPAELFGGYRTKNSPNPVPEKLLRHPKKILNCTGGLTPVGQVSSLIKSVSQNSQNSSPSKILSTEFLRLKLMKRLKAKKKKLAKLNQLLSTEEGESTPRPDSTDISSPYSVTSSTSAYDNPAFDHFFAELLSPSMSASNLSPDSTGHVEIPTNSQSAGTSESISQKNSTPVSRLSCPLLNVSLATNDDFLDELISGGRGNQSVIENAEHYALDIFI